MSVIDILRKRKFWISMAVSMVILLILWVIGAWLLVKGTMTQESMTGWVCGTYLVSGLTGGILAGRKENGGMKIALILAAIMVCLSILAAWIMYGGVSLADGGWKTMLFTLLGASVAGMITARKKTAGVKRRPMKRR